MLQHLLDESIGPVKLPEHRVPGEDMHAQFRAYLFGRRRARECIESLYGIRLVCIGCQTGMDNSYHLGSARAGERNSASSAHNYPGGAPGRPNITCAPDSDSNIFDSPDPAAADYIALLINRAAILEVPNLVREGDGRSIRVRRFQGEADQVSEH